MEQQLSETRSYIERFFDQVVEGLPEFLGALVILIVTYFVALALGRATRLLLNKAGVNERLHAAPGGPYIQRAVPSPSRLIGKIVFWIVFLLGLSLSLSVLDVPVLNDFLRAVYGYMPNVLAALLIFLAASALSAGTVRLVSDMMGDTPTGKVFATAVPIVVMSIAAFMILNQLKIAEDIVVITYAALLGSASLGMALAFGLGGREVAGRMLGDLYEKGRASKDRIRRDARTGATRARSRTARLR